MLLGQHGYGNQNRDLPPILRFERGVRCDFRFVFQIPRRHNLSIGRGFMSVGIFDGLQLQGVSSKGKADSIRLSPHQTGATGAFRLSPGMPRCFRGSSPPRALWPSHAAQQAA